MAGLTSREGEAIKKALALDTLVDLSQKVDRLEREIKLEEGYTRYRANEATRILEPQKAVDGIEIRPAGPLFENMVNHLDESGLISALTVVKSVMVDLEAKRAEWLKNAHAQEDEAGFLPGKKFNKETYNNLTLSS